MVAPKSNQILNNSRFYILSFSVLLSGLALAWLRITIPSDQLFFIRTQQIFGLLSVIYLYFALIISPIGYAIGKYRTKKLEFSRRAIGVSAFYFAALHGVIALWAQLGGPEQLQYLPDLFKWSLAGGFAAFIVLGFMAATSFDKVIQFMTPRRWKWLHRFIYIAGILIIIHVWSIGTHLAYGGVQLAAFCGLVILTGLESFKITGLLNEKYLHFGKSEKITLFITFWSIIVALILAIPFLIENYHGAHEAHSAVHIQESRR